MAKKRVMTPAALAASKNNLAKARLVEAQKHGKGHQTAAQLAAERANLAKARAALKTHAHGKRTGFHGGVHHASRTPGRRPLGTYRLRFASHSKLTIHKPNGINPRFKKEIAPDGFERRTAWRKATRHHMKKHLIARRHRGPHVKQWRMRKHYLTPK